MSQVHHVAAFQTAPVPSKGWLSRNKRLAIALGCLGLPLLFCMFGGAVFTVAMVSMRSCDAYQLALRRAERDPTVIAELGGPIKEGWFTMGHVKVLGAEGEATLAIPITGPRGSGKINVRASKSAGTWTFSELNVSVAGRPEPVSLLPPP